MARYSAAAAGVAAVSSIEVDAAMIKVIVTDPAAEGAYEYTLDLSAITSDASLRITGKAFSYYLWGKSASVATFAKSSQLYNFDPGTSIGIPGKEWQWFEVSSYSGWRSTSGISGFRISQGGSNYTYGWLKATIGSSVSSFTLNSYGYNSTLNESAIAGQGSAAVPDSGPGVVGLALLGAGAAGMRLLRKLRAGK
jgi:hypothetical protein